MDRSIVVCKIEQQLNQQTESFQHIAFRKLISLSIFGQKIGLYFL